MVSRLGLEEFLYQLDLTFQNGPSDFNERSLSLNMYQGKCPWPYLSMITTNAQCTTDKMTKARLHDKFDLNIIHKQVLTTE